MTESTSTREKFGLGEFVSARRSKVDGTKTDCVEIARRNGRAEIRDSKNLRFKSLASYEANSLSLSEGELEIFLAGFIAGDVSGSTIEVTTREDGMTVFRSEDTAASDVELVYTPSEIAAFRDGIENDEFSASAMRSRITAAA